MNNSSLMKRVVSTEYLLMAVLVALFFVVLGEFDWWWLFLLFPLVDVSAVGYLKDSRVGALFYNIGHSLVGPGIFALLFVIQGQSWELFVALVWLFHIFVDRALGYGLKHTKGFGHTHLGTVGKAKKRRSSTKRTK